MYDRTRQSTADQIALGDTVYDAAGEKVGSIAQYDPQAGYLLVEKGLIFRKDIYIPMSAISRIDQSGVFLQLYKDDLQGDLYASPPVASTTAGTTTVGTTPATIGTVDTMDRGTATMDTATTDQADIRVPVREEELVVGKQQQEAGRVHIHKDVEEVPETADVTLRRETVTVERVPYSGEPTTDAELFQERDIDVPVMGEEAVAAKRVQGVEEVRVHKDVVEEQEQVSDTVRKERVTVDGTDVQDRTIDQR
jgi:uncharacterized protein (TIGR02271 family)